LPSIVWWHFPYTGLITPTANAPAISNAPAIAKLITVTNAFIIAPFKIRGGVIPRPFPATCVYLLALRHQAKYKARSILGSFRYRLEW